MIKRCKSLLFLSLNKLDPVPIWCVLFGMYWETAVNPGEVATTHYLYEVAWGIS